MTAALKPSKVQRMPRPRRYAPRTERLVLFVHPDTREAITAKAVADKVPLGVIVDRLVVRSARLANGEEAKGLRASSPVTFGPGVVVPNPRGGVEIVQYPSAPKRQGRRSHREGVTSSGAIKCLDCNTMKMNRAAWDQPCPGPTKEEQ